MCVIRSSSGKKVSLLLLYMNIDRQVPWQLQKVPVNKNPESCHIIKNNIGAFVFAIIESKIVQSDVESVENENS